MRRYSSSVVAGPCGYHGSCTIKNVGTHKCNTAIGKECPNMIGLSCWTNNHGCGSCGCRCNSCSANKKVLAFTASRIIPSSPATIIALPGSSTTATIQSLKPLITTNITVTAMNTDTSLAFVANDHQAMTVNCDTLLSNLNHDQAVIDVLSATLNADTSPTVKPFKFKETADINWCKTYIPKNTKEIEISWMSLNNYLHSRFGYPDQEKYVFRADKDRVTGQEIANLCHIHANFIDDQYQEGIFKWILRMQMFENIDDDLKELNSRAAEPIERTETLKETETVIEKDEVSGENVSSCSTASGTIVDFDAPSDTLGATKSTIVSSQVVDLTTNESSVLPLNIKDRSSEMLSITGDVINCKDTNCSLSNELKLSSGSASTKCFGFLSTELLFQTDSHVTTTAVTTTTVTTTTATAVTATATSLTNEVVNVTPALLTVDIDLLQRQSIQAAIVEGEEMVCDTYRLCELVNMGRSLKFYSVIDSSSLKSCIKTGDILKDHQNALLVFVAAIKGTSRNSAIVFTFSKSKTDFELDETEIVPCENIIEIFINMEKTLTMRKECNTQVMEKLLDSYIEIVLKELEAVETSLTTTAVGTTAATAIPLDNVVDAVRHPLTTQGIFKDFILSDRLSENIRKELQKNNLNSLVVDINELLIEEMKDLTELKRVKISNNLNESYEREVGGSKILLRNFHRKVEKNIKPLNDFINGHIIDRLLLYRWDLRAAIYVTDRAGKGSKVFYSMCLIWSKTAGWYIILTLMTTLCQVPRPDWLVYCVEDGNVYKWEGSPTIFKNEFVCLPTFPLPVELLEKAMFRWFDQHSIIYDPKRLEPRDMKDPSKRIDHSSLTNVAKNKAAKDSKQKLLDWDIGLGNAPESETILEKRKVQPPQAVYDTNVHNPKKSVQALKQPTGKALQQANAKKMLQNIERREAIVRNTPVPLLSMYKANLEVNSNAIEFGSVIRNAQKQQPKRFKTVVTTDNSDTSALATHIANEAKYEQLSLARLQERNHLKKQTLNEEKIGNDIELQRQKNDNANELKRQKIDNEWELEKKKNETKHNANWNIYNEREETRIGQDAEERKARHEFERRVILKGMSSRSDQQIHDNAMEVLHLSSAHNSANIMNKQFHNSGNFKNDTPAPIQTSSSSSSSAVNEEVLRKLVRPMLKEYLLTPPAEDDVDEEGDANDWDKEEE